MPPVVLDVLTVVALAVAQPERTLLQDRVTAVPEGERQAEPLGGVTDATEPVLAPPEDARARMVEGEVGPGVAVAAVVLADGAPRARRDVRTPVAPRRPAGVGVGEAPPLGAARG